MDANNRDVWTVHSLQKRKKIYSQKPKKSGTVQDVFHSKAIPLNIIRLTILKMIPWQSSKRKNKIRMKSIQCEHGLTAKIWLVILIIKLSNQVLWHI